MIFEQGMVERMDFDELRVGNIPSVMYVPDFISSTEETHLLNNVSISSFIIVFYFNDDITF